MNFKLSAHQKVYFASDFHLGVPSYEKSRERENRIIQWLHEVKQDAAAIFLLGDLFDFWFEYKTTIPKGFVRIQAAIASIVEEGIPVHLFTGNHDMWIFDYLPKELGVQLYREPIEIQINHKLFLIGHGDGLGPGDKKYKMLKRFFASHFCQWCFARIHPNLGMAIAHAWSIRSRKLEGTSEDFYKGDEREYLVQYCEDKLKTSHYDFFVFGHRHLPISKQIGNSLYINTGDWLRYDTYAVFDGKQLELREYKRDG